MTRMRVEARQEGRVRILRLEGDRLTYPVLGPFFTQVQREVENGARQLVVDLGLVTYVDSAAIGCLLDMHRLLHGRGGDLKLIQLQPRVLTMLSMTGLHRVMSIHTNEAEALAAYKKSEDRNA